MERWRRGLRLGLALVVLATGAPALAQERPSDRPPDRRAERSLSGGAPESLRQFLMDQPPALRRKAVRRLRRMSPERREAFFRRFDSLSPEGRERMARHLRGGARERELEPRVEGDRAPRAERRQQLDENRRAWREMEPGRREEMRRRLRRFRTLSAEEQEAVVDERFSSRSEAERRRILERLRAASERLPD